jgi:hypothetical protein
MRHVLMVCAVLLPLLIVITGCASPRIIPIRATDPDYLRHSRLQQMLATTTGYPVSITTEDSTGTRTAHWGYITALRNDSLFWADGKAGKRTTAAPVTNLRSIVCAGCRRDFRPTGAVAGIVFGYGLPIAATALGASSGLTATSIVTAVAGGFLGWFIGASQSSTEVRWEMEKAKGR